MTEGHILLDELVQCVWHLSRSQWTTEWEKRFVELMGELRDRIGGPDLTPEHTAALKARLFKEMGPASPAASIPMKREKQRKSP